MIHSFSKSIQSIPINNFKIAPYTADLGAMALITLVSTVANQVLVGDANTKSAKLKKFKIFIITSGSIALAALALGSPLASLTATVVISAVPVVLLDRLIMQLDSDDEEGSMSNSSPSSSSNSISSEKQKTKKKKQTKPQKFRSTVLDQTRDVSTSNPVSVSDSHKSLEDFLKATFKEESSGLWIGTTQKDSAAIKVLTHHMKDLKKQGVQAIYLPFLPNQSDKFEHDLITSTTPKAKTKSSVKDCLGGISFSSVTLLDLFEAAKKEGLHFSITHGDEKFKYSDAKWIGNARTRCGKYVILDILGDSDGVAKQMKSGKCPIAHQLGIPSLIVESSDSANTVKIKTDQKKKLCVSGQLFVPKKFGSQ